MLLGHQEESERSPVVVAPYMGRIFSKKAFHGWGRGGTFWTNLCETTLKIVHWRVDRDVGSYSDLGTSLLKRFTWEDWGRKKLFMVPCHNCNIYATWRSKEVRRHGRF